jgi:hypothetical protein
MRSQSRRSFVRAFGGVGLAAMLALLTQTTPLRADSGPFGDLTGRWTGSGTIAVANGTKERIRCRVNYYTTQTGKSFQQNMTCASDSYRFEVTSNIYASGNNLSGSWSEHTNKATGSVTGRGDKNKISANVRGTGFSATISITTNGNQQAVLIRPKGTDVREVSIALRKGGG